MARRDRWILGVGFVLFVIELAVVLTWAPARPALNGILTGSALSAISYLGVIMLLGQPHIEQHPLRAVGLMLAKAIIVAGAAIAALTWAKVHMLGFLIGFSNLTIFARVLAGLIGPIDPPPPSQDQSQ
jgi:hypothetical protein